MSTSAEQQRISVVTLSCATELVARVVSEVMGNDVGDSINNVPVTLAATSDLAVSRFQKTLNINNAS